MNKIISLEYSFNPTINRAFLTIQSDVFEPVFKNLGFDTRIYQRGDYDVFAPLEGYMVRGIGVEPEETFSKVGNNYHIQTQRVGNAHILIKTDGNGVPIVNISHLRLTGTKKGRKFEIHPISAAKVKTVLNTFCQGACFYYSKLKKYNQDISKFSKKTA